MGLLPAWLKLGVCWFRPRSRLGRRSQTRSAGRVEDVLPQQREEGLHRCVVAGGADPAHRALQMVRLQRGNELPGPELTLSLWTTQPATAAGPRRATALLRASTASGAFIRSLIEWPTIRPEQTCLFDGAVGPEVCCT